jgi:type IV pilus assembly protein PilC
MAFFVYSCVTPEGSHSWRTGSFDGLEALLAELDRRGETLDRFFELPEDLQKLTENLRGNLAALQVAEFCNYLSLYVQGGLDLQTALADLARGGRDAAVRTAAERIRRDLLSGFPLSEAMTRSKQFPEIVVSMAKIGETSGNLPQMLADAAAYVERVQEIKSTSLRALLYPAFTLTMLLLAGGFWIVVVVPKLATVYKNMDIELPLATKLMIGLSDAAASGWVWAISAAVGAWAAFVVFRRFRGFRQFFDRVAWSMPIFGNVVRNAQSAFFFQYLALVYKAGVPIVDAIGSLIETVGNRYFRQRIRRMPEHLRLGLTLREVFQRTNIFPPLDVRMIGIGEQTGALDAQLEKLAALYMQRVKVAVDLLTKAIEPLLVLVMGGMFVFFVVAMMAPLYSLVSQMMSQIGGQ